ncbi:GNAT family N-acetyltransferase [Clostridium estertheticum]|uniref:GNAT family N-acetyltransferase n=1 Tax=Clostridium estertheticum TaxID=238834 RepID=UPI001C0E60AA|nr:GNAT family N-acetyltransferase [Clostridium estertheticum]MBU3201936.1 GNAT family N-acetyltransferase [Clostridium estertheticum]WAG67822.1 GNAT family N-acetyltransferase [Clostridium estertheticum]
MKTYKDLVFEEINEEDISILTPIMKRAFDEDTCIHLGKECGGPPGYDNGDFLRQFALHKDSTSYKISMNGKVIGAIILWINNSSNQNFLGNVFIDNELENKGIGKKVWGFVELEFPNTEIWKTETPIFSRRNHNFYVNKCGFHVVKIENPKDLEEGSFILEKRMK